MKKKSSLLLITISLLATVVMLYLFVYWMKPKSLDDEKITVVPTAADSEPKKNNQNQLESNPPPPVMLNNTQKTGIENLPRSLQDTKVDGEIIIDENKKLVVTYGLRRLFDYFLSAMGEESAEAIHARVENYIRSHTPEPAASQAVEIYHAYINYLQALTGLEENYGHVQMQVTQNGEMDLDLIKQRRNDMKKIRQQFFDEETIKAFFTQEDDFENYTVSMLEIESNDNLTDSQKQQEKDNYISLMPESEDKKILVEYQAQQQALATLINRTEELRKQGATAQELYTMRVALVGAPAAKRLAKVDEEEANFAQRFDHYQTNKKLIVAQFGAESPETTTKLDELEKSLFNEAEIKRLVGYEAVRNETMKNSNEDTP